MLLFFLKSNLVVNVHVHVLTRGIPDSIEEIYCYMAVKLSGNIVVHTLIESFFYLQFKFFPDFITLYGFDFSC